METFKCSTDVEQLKNHPFHATVESPVLPVIAEYPQYVPEEDGHLVLIEPHNVDRILDDQNRP